VVLPVSVNDRDGQQMGDHQAAKKQNQCKCLLTTSSPVRLATAMRGLLICYAVGNGGARRK
jgi:hypothetical protein